MSLLSRLFGRGSGAAAAPPTPAEVHKDFAIFPEPIREGGTYRLCARIEKEIGGELKTHRMVRADTFESLETAKTESINKAKLFIDQTGERLFG